MTNLLKETLSTLQGNDKTTDDVLWVGAADYGYMTWQEFADVADFIYDDGYGTQEIANDLVVVGNNWWLERGEYDGLEWWDYKELPVKPMHHMQVKGVPGGRWRTLEEIVAPRKTDRVWPNSTPLLSSSKASPAPPPMASPPTLPHSSQHGPPAHHPRRRTILPQRR